MALGVATWTATSIAQPAAPETPSPEAPEPTPPVTPPPATPPPVLDGFPPPGALPPGGGARPGAAPEPKREQQAYEASKQRIQETVDQLLEVPETPAAFALGLSSDVVARPNSFREVAGAFKTVIGPEATLIPGAAIEFAPFYRMVAEDATAKQWVDELHRPLLGGLRLSVATASDPRAPDPDDAATLVALGARIGIDTTDVRYHEAAIRKLVTALVDCAPGPTLPTGAEGEPTRLEWKPDCKFSQRESDLVAELSGIRAELAGTVTFADRELGGDDDAEARAWHAWAAFEGRFSGALGVGVAAEYQATRESTDYATNLRGGARVNLDTTRLAASLGAAYVRRSEDEAGKNWLDVGGAISAKLSTLAVVSIGAQTAQSLDRGTSDLIALVSLASASGNSLITEHLDLEP